jgi:hypothetical protein
VIKDTGISDKLFLVVRYLKSIIIVNIFFSSTENANIRSKENSWSLLIQRNPQTHKTQVLEHPIRRTTPGIHCKRLSEHQLSLQVFSGGDQGG